MRRFVLFASVAVTALVLIATPGSAGPEPSGLKPNHHYALAWGQFAYSELEQIGMKTGTGTPVWSMGVEFVTDGASWQGWTPFGLAFDVDGTMYITQNIIGYHPSLVRSQLARVDSKTGAVTPIGTPVPFNTSGPDIDARGNLYVCGFQVEACAAGPASGARSVGGTGRRIGLVAGLGAGMGVSIAPDTGPYARIRSLEFLSVEFMRSLKLLG